MAKRKRDPVWWQRQKKMPEPAWLKRYKKLWAQEHAPSIPAFGGLDENGEPKVTLISRAEWRRTFGAGMAVTGRLAAALARGPADPKAQSHQPPGPSSSPDDLADWVAPPPSTPEEQ